MFQRLILCGLGEENWGVFGVIRRELSTAIKKFF